LDNTTLIANYIYICPVVFTIRADTLKLVDPSATNFHIPIYITADKDISYYIVEKLIIEIDRNIFFPKSVDNGIFTKSNKDAVIEMIFEKVKVPDLKPNKEKILFNIIGDVILADKDSGDIIIKSVRFSEELNKEPKLINGYIMLDICREGGDRLLGSVGHSPSISAKNNPATATLEVECKVVESGNYSLEIVDLSGGVIKIKE
jgi:hypothetical protein